MKKYLVDVNLPKFFSFFNSEIFIHVSDINPKMSDSEIWNYALKNQLIILSKDVDFYTPFMAADKKCKVVYFNLGNLKLDALHLYFEKNWSLIVHEIDSCHLIIAEQTSIKVMF